ncbi:PilZ domain-containing protein [Endothiovibrio diazotrophicus]
MDERRDDRRHHLIYYLRVWDVEEGELLGHLADLTTGGFLLVGDRPLEVGREFALEIQWDDDDGVPREIRLRAVSRWSNNDVNPEFYDTGFQLVDAANDLLFPLQDLISDMGFND